ncbi:hypothetical protein GLOIN_2v1782204 [Rhizophagus irregularis DAOM 181602=DAOM 197198]|nr:hypothetical protein GLOIN_2v1782204 [Rhizophagus irregularis DAOM 181602=DAOM 197198]POG65021.1 hypothetical protein GLOIN_2v1782204 [Rhizophagus irregularis DAOM 181602=DAOM 197198]|eukprot:XP_025171887.1 hypothetical protein GLOIN_2v1782204 [Rhizophagus irregularis DAOM 181602=DAOM 197198]
MRYLFNRDLSDFEPQEIPKYFEWCEENGEKPFSNNITGKKFSDIDDVKEFSDIFQDDLPKNETTDIPIFNMPETIPQKIITPQLEHHNRVANRKNKPSPNTSKNKKASNQDDLIQILFDYVATEIPVASTSGTSEASKISELFNKPETSKPSKPIEPISNVIKAPKPSSNEILSARAQREEHLRKWAIDHNEDPDIFMNITEKDVNQSQEYQDRMMADAEVIKFARENKMNSNDLFYMTRRERLISEEIYLWEFEHMEKPQKYIYDDKE